ncbi:MAG: carbohydrate-binding domain-containing protein [Clostridiales bacterium]|nr:carbohydrate-binding domain-containing protein [Clostridiales bacterium]
MRYKKTAIILLICLALFFTACNKPHDGFGGSNTGSGNFTDPTDSTVSHEHTYNGVWQYDETNHWQAATCEHTEEKGYLEEHRYESVTIDNGYISYDCTVCNYSNKEKAELSIVCLEGTEGCYSITNDTITFTGITADSVYAISGTFAGNIVVDVDENLKFELEMQGLSLYSSAVNPITVLNGDKFTLTAKKDTINTIHDLRKTIGDTDEMLYKGAIYSHIDLDVKGKGTLSVISEHNNGIQTKDDLDVKNLTLTVNCQDNALKGNDSVTLTGGNITLIAKSGDGIKTENSDISDKGNQRGTVMITESILEINAACDGIDAAYNVVIDNESTIITINTDKYSEYSEEVTDVSESVYYIRYSNQNYKYSIKYYNSDEDYVWENAVYYKSVSGGRGEKYCYYSFPIRSKYQKIKLFVYSSSQEQGQEEDYQTCTDYISWNTAYDTIAVSSRGYSWTNFTTITGNFGGGFGGGMGGIQDGNTDKGDYSTKGIKAANEIIINAGAVSIKSYDDSIHANNDGGTLDNGENPTGNVSIYGGQICVYSNDDGLHADGNVSVFGGEVSVLHSYEGIEGKTVKISGGSTSIVSSDDGINGTGTNGTSISVSGGDLYVYAGGDGIDSNSTSPYNGITFSGGKTVIISTSNGNSAIDSERGYSYTGGNVLAIMPSGGMNKETTNCSNFSSVGTKTVKSVSSGTTVAVSVSSETVMTVEMPCGISGMFVYLGSNSATVSAS